MRITGISFRSTFTLFSFFPFTDRVPFGPRLHVVYLFMCQCCGKLYVSQTCRYLRVRISDHVKISALTGKKLGSHSLFAISHHHRDTSHPLTPNDFSILTSSSTSFKLLLKESLLINKLKPSFNATITSYPLSFFGITNESHFNFKPLVILNSNLFLRHL